MIASVRNRSELRALVALPDRDADEVFGEGLDPVAAR
jgi:hypothetical protein